MNTIQRIKQYIDFKEISVRKFEETVGFSNGSFSSQLKNNKTIGVDKLENILSIYPEINPTWLLTGEGSMVLDETGEKLNQYARTAKNKSDLHAKAITWLIFSMYKKQSGSDFSFDSFQKLVDIFNLASTYTEVLQNSLETELYAEAVDHIKDFSNLNDEGAIIIPESLTKSIDKYAEAYKNLEIMCINLMDILNNPSMQKKIFLHLKKE